MKDAYKNFTRPGCIATSATPSSPPVRENRSSTAPAVSLRGSSRHGARGGHRGEVQVLAHRLRAGLLWPCVRAPGNGPGSPPWARSALAAQGVSGLGWGLCELGFAFFLIVFSFEISVCCIEVWLTAGLGNTALSLRDGRVPEKHQELRNVPNTSLESRFCTSLGTVGSDGKGTKQNQVLGAHPFSPCWKERDQEAEQGGGSRGISLGANPLGLPISSL